ncbi:MAG: DNA methylase [Bacteroidales bacterium]|nr:DNA methylase [Bacteroidales bacterium]
MSKQEKIICLGKEFNSEEERREYYRNELRTKLPELKKIEGFPIGEDEDIINLSDPPYYTACPNPWLNDFIDEWEKEKENNKLRSKSFVVNEPYGHDVKEGVNNPVYNAHSYHTKVPHPAIMRFILHYTQPGDIVVDAFAGTGMCGVAANACENPDFESKHKIESEWKSAFAKLPTWGRRHAVVSDLSPIASFISHNYNSKIDLNQFLDDSDSLFEKVEKECKWMFETNHTEKIKGKINYTVWSECILCPNCNTELILYKETVDYKTGSVSEKFNCSNCDSELEKGDCEKVKITYYDSFLKTTISKIKYVPVLINYSLGTKRNEKIPDQKDILRIEKIEAEIITSWVPSDFIVKGDKSSDPYRVGITNVHQFYSKSNLILLSKCFDYARSYDSSQNLIFVLTSMLPKLTNMNRYMPQHGSRALVGPMANTLYIPPFYVENNSLDQYTFQKKKIAKAFVGLNFSPGSIHSATKNIIKDNSIDYVFTDPPFGANIMYSELNFLSESWLKVKTNNKEEAIQNKTQGKSTLDYQNLMTDSFREYYRILKSGRWMTVEFSNTSAAVWNAIQNSIQRAGFIISSVTAIDNTRGGLHAMLGPTAVKQNLIISCYKPEEGFVEKIISGNAELSIWEFVETHLKHLPVHLKHNNQTFAILERNPKVILDRLISFFIVRGLPVPIDARDFHEGLKQRFVEIDEMYFNKEQAAEYDEKKSKAPQLIQLSLIVTNESDAIEWLKERLRKKKEKYNEIMPDFRIATQSLRKGDTLPELQHILNESFIQEDDGKWRTPDPNEAKDREALRAKVLLKEFGAYVIAISQPRAKKLKEVRVEALRAGFKNSWEQKDFKTIVTLGDMIPQNILLEDEQLLMYYDIAKDRV